MKFEKCQVAWSSGTDAPKTIVPPGAVDCHMHVFDRTFAVAPGARDYSIEASVAQYRTLQRRLGTSRNIVVQASTYGTDNSGLMRTMSEFEEGEVRGVAVVDTTSNDEQLRELDRAGVRGLRFNLQRPGGATRMDMLETLSHRIAALGWHIQLNAPPELIFEEQAMLSRLPCPLVFDHYANVLLPSGEFHPAYSAVKALLQTGNAWIKLSAPYLNSRVGAPTYSDIGLLARSYVAEAPERLVWASNWPHPTEEQKPDDAQMLDNFNEWVGSEQLLRKIMVDNPCLLYGFAGT